MCTAYRPFTNHKVQINFSVCKCCVDGKNEILVIIIDILSNTKAMRSIPCHVISPKRWGVRFTGSQIKIHCFECKFLNNKENIIKYNTYIKCLPTREVGYRKNIVVYIYLFVCLVIFFLECLIVTNHSDLDGSIVSKKITAPSKWVPAMISCQICKKKWKSTFYYPKKKSISIYRCHAIECLWP